MANLNSDDRSPEVMESTDRARQAVTGHNVRYVLIFGLLGVLVAFAALLVGFAD